MPMRDVIISYTIKKFEGGWVNNPMDKGGPTNWGITMQTYSEFMGFPATPEMIQSLSFRTAVSVYEWIWSRNQISELPPIIQHFYWDIVVNSGPHEACLILQRALATLGTNIEIDGKLGSYTIKMATAAAISNSNKLLSTMIDERVAFYKRIVDRDFTQNQFLNGWLARADWFRIHALTMDGTIADVKLV